MIKCPQCQEELNDNAKFCVNCGFKLPCEESAPAEQQIKAEEAKAPEKQPAPAPAPKAPEAPKKKKKKFPVWAIILIVVAALTVVGILLTLVAVGAAIAIPMIIAKQNKVKEQAADSANYQNAKNIYTEYASDSYSSGEPTDNLIIELDGDCYYIVHNYFVSEKKYENLDDARFALINESGLYDYVLEKTSFDASWHGYSGATVYKFVPVINNYENALQAFSEFRNSLRGYESFLEDFVIVESGDTYFVSVYCFLYSDEYDNFDAALSMLDYYMYYEYRSATYTFNGCTIYSFYTADHDMNYIKVRKVYEDMLTGYEADGDYSTKSQFCYAVAFSDEVDNCYYPVINYELNQSICYSFYEAMDLIRRCMIKDGAYETIGVNTDGCTIIGINLY